MTNVEFAKRLEDLAALYRENPEAVQPYETMVGGLSIMVHDKAELAATIRAFGGGVKKDNPIGPPTIDFKPIMWQDFHLTIHVFKDRLCERVVTGTRVIPETVIPARPAEPEHTIPEREEQIVEWRCHPLLDNAPIEVGK